MQTAMYGHPTYSPFVYSPSLATLILSQCLVTTTSNSIFAFLHTSTYPNKQENHSCKQFDNTYLSKSSSKVSQLFDEHISRRKEWQALPKTKLQLTGCISNKRK